MDSGFSGTSTPARSAWRYIPSSAAGYLQQPLVPASAGFLTSANPRDSSAAGNSGGRFVFRPGGIFCGCLKPAHGNAWQGTLPRTKLNEQEENPDSRCRAPRCRLPRVAIAESHTNRSGRPGPARGELRRRSGRRHSTVRSPVVRSMMMYADWLAQPFRCCT